MFTKVLISFALLAVAAQANYAPSHYGSVAGGYAAHLEPALTLTVLPSYGNGYGAAPSYGHHDSYAPHHGYGPITIPYHSSKPTSYYKGVDGNALNLANLALGLPSAGAPIPTSMHIPQYSSTGYTAPVQNTHYGSLVNGKSAAVAASNVDDHSSSLSY